LDLLVEKDAELAEFGDSLLDTLDAVLLNFEIVRKK